MNLKSRIQSHLKQKNPLDTINEFTRAQYRDNETVKVFVELHNESELDLIQIYYELKNNKSMDFFRVRYLLEDTLPHLKIIDLTNLLKTLEIVIIEAGDDGMSHSPLKSFESLLDTDLKFACNILEHLKSNEYKVSFATKALVSIAKQNLALCLEKAEELIKLKNDKLNVDVVLALGQLKYSLDDELIDKSIDIICLASNLSSDEKIISATLHSLIQISKNKLSSYIKIGNLIKNIIHTTNHSPMVVHVCMVQLFHLFKKIPKEIKILLLETIPFIKLESNNTIHYLDMLMSNFIEENSDQALKLLEEFFYNTNYEISIDKFNNFSSYLLENENLNKLSSICTRWFFSRKISLNYYASELLSNHEIDIQFDLSQLNNEFSQDHLFLAKKACGWCFMNSYTAISLIFSVFKSCPEEQTKAISEVIFNPLMISYPRKVSEFLQKNREMLNEEKRKQIDTLIQNLEKYHQALKLSGDVKELWVKPSQHFEYRRHHQQKMNQAYAKSRKESAFAGLFTENTLLYGKSTAFIVQTNEGSIRQTMPLHSYSHTIDFPLLEILDSTSLHHCLLSFKVEGAIK
ncbi:MAG: hypothetical protein Q4F77_09460 [Acinetobacter sp.]|uniref:hypothetical protein n=1 Tax=Acinetobacter sp. TaxID=472 RepID=UPI0026E09238|nr:hypothetical protein [Acinetobacter sp.]MDO5543521.1 hypothetical protein [Acinetobacter sp.]